MSEGMIELPRSTAREAWSIAGHLSVRLIVPPASPRDNVDLFLESHGRSEAQVLSNYVYSHNRSKAERTEPDPRRYRDWRQALRAIGLLYDKSQPANRTIGSPRQRIVQVTELGQAVRRWRANRDLNEANAPVLGRYGAQALSSCQLRNPTDEGKEYSEDVVVFPYAFIWRAMLRLDGKISSEELNRAIFRTNNEEDLEEAIDRIAGARLTGDVAALGEEVATDPKRKNDRVLIWMSLASFGWTLIGDKRATSSWYTIPNRMRPVLEAAASLKRRHLTFATEQAYVEHISSQACVPPDVRGLSL